VSHEALIAGLALLLNLVTLGVGAIRRVAKGSFVNMSQFNALKDTISTNRELHAGRISDVEHSVEMLEERLSHFPDRKQFDELKDDIAEIRVNHATVMARLEEIPRMREAFDDLAREIRESRR
jgi:hypothetical protein